ncbi:MAG: DUF3368 domain-containing protein [Caldilineaceae bacterium]|nr:DUF3368 domain-containing protein [Caldilineaceae bacterium]
MANRLGLRVTGTLGILLQARRNGLISSIHPVLEMLQIEGFHISEALMQFMLQSTDEK